MKIKDAYHGVFTYFEENLNSVLSKEIHQYKRGYMQNLTELDDRSFLMIGYEGNIDDSSMADPEKEIKAEVYCRVANSITLEDDVFDLLDEVTQFVNDNPTMAGVDFVTMQDWAVDFSDDMQTEGALTFTMSVKFH